VVKQYISAGKSPETTPFYIGRASALKEHSRALTALTEIPQVATSAARKICTSPLSITLKTKARTISMACLPSEELMVRLLFSERPTLLDRSSTSKPVHLHSAMTIVVSIRADPNFTNASHSLLPNILFGEHFPEITQTIDNSFEVIHDKLSRIDITYVSFQQPMSHQGPSLYIQISIASRTANGSSPHSGVPGIFFKVDVEPVRLTLIQRTTTFAEFFIRCVGVIGGKFVCVSWGLPATDRTISVVAGPDDTGSIVLPDSARSGGLRSKWSGSALRACSSNASLKPGVWAEAGSPYGVSSYSSSPAGSPMLP
jgi:hypothetical protein